MTTKVSRALTPGEIALARSMFGDAIDYAPVRLVKGKWWPFQPQQRRRWRRPATSISIPTAALWSEDFAKEPLGRQGLFIHEMTHVWQAQTTRPLLPAADAPPFCRYAYELEPGKPFDRYGLEQQAEIVRHRFLADAGAQLTDRSTGRASAVRLRALL